MQTNQIDTFRRPSAGRVPATVIIALLGQRDVIFYTMIFAEGFEAGAHTEQFRQREATRCRRSATTGTKIFFRKALTGFLEVSTPQDTTPAPSTREPFDDVDPMPDYENVLTD